MSYHGGSATELSPKAATMKSQLSGKRLVAHALQDGKHRKPGLLCTFMPRVESLVHLQGSRGLAGCCWGGPQSQGWPIKQKPPTWGEFQLRFHPVLKRTPFLSPPTCCKPAWVTLSLQMSYIFRSDNPLPHLGGVTFFLILPRFFPFF